MIRICISFPQAHLSGAVLCQRGALLSTGGAGEYARGDAPRNHYWEIRDGSDRGKREYNSLIYIAHK